jgi:hypothetical protein
MALHDMAVEPVAELHAAFEVDRSACFTNADIRLIDGLSNCSSGLFIGIQIYDGQTNAIVRNALVYFQFGRDSSLDCDVKIVIFFSDVGYDSERFDYSGKHGFILLHLLLQK